jgi:hypothetical protein
VIAAELAVTDAQVAWLSLGLVSSGSRVLAWRRVRRAEAALLRVLVARRGAAGLVWAA